MPEINLCNEAGRDAAVNMASVSIPLQVRWVDGQGRQVQSVRILKSTLDIDVNALTQQYGPLADLSQALIDGDPEVDIENVGSLLKNTSRVLVSVDRKVVHRAEQFEIIKNPDGSQRERRSKVVSEKNISAQSPLAWSGKFIKRQQAIRKFVFANKLQLSHVNGLTYDFLFGIAKKLEEADSMMLLGAGPKSNQPLILRRGSTPFRGFLEGRTDGDKYCLLLHLSNLEMKPPADEQPASE